MARNLILLVCAVLFGASAFAHDNDQHVMGTVVRISQKSIAVETTVKTTLEVQIVPEPTSAEENQQVAANSDKLLTPSFFTFRSQFAANGRDLQSIFMTGAHDRLRLRLSEGLFQVTNHCALCRWWTFW
jgi:hypothetical protein